MGYPTYYEKFTKPATRSYKGEDINITAFQAIMNYKMVACAFYLELLYSDFGWLGSVGFESDDCGGHSSI